MHVMGNSLALRRPAAVVDALDPKEGDEIEIWNSDPHLVSRSLFLLWRCLSARCECTERWCLVSQARGRVGPSR